MNTDDVSKKEKKQKQACNTFSNAWNRIYRSEKIRYNKFIHKRELRRTICRNFQNIWINV